MGRKAVICECSSNGTFLIDDCRKMGLDPVVVYPPIPDEETSLIGEIRRSSESKIGGSAEIIRKSGMDEVADMLSGCDVACVMAGSEYGVPFADMLSRRLGLPGNDPSTTADRTEKLQMHRALERAGMRCIRTVPVSSEDDIRGFWRGTPAVVKPSRSGGTVGFHLCHTLDECISAYRSLTDTPDWTGGDGNEPIIQDYIGGTEYIVNTLSRDGVHRITDMWAYRKQNVGDGMAYDCAMSVTEPDESEEAVAEYALDVLRATGMDNGPAHIELKSDESGPVLIEINARPMGGAFSKDSLDRCLGHHITDLALRSAIDPGFIRTLPEGIPIMRDFILKVMIVHEDRWIDTEPLSELVKGFGSFNRISLSVPPGERRWATRTEDLEMSPGSVEFIQPDGGSAMDDFALLSNIEKRFPDLIYGREDGVTAACGSMDVPDGFAIVDQDGLRLPEGAVEGLAVLSAPEGLPSFYRSLYDGIRAVPSGGTVMVDPAVDGMIPYGRKGVNILLMVAGLDFDLAETEGPHIATKP